MTEFKKMLFKNKGRIISTALLNIASDTAQGVAVLKASKSLWEKFESSKEMDKRTEVIDSVDFIKLDNVGFRFEQKEVLQIKSMNFRQGGKYALVGESGCGKTTLAKILMGLLENYTRTVPC